MRARAILGFLVLVVALGLRLPDAAAHVVLTDSCPGVDERISDLPTVRFTFDGPLIVDEATPAVMELRGAGGGEAVPLGPVQLVGVNALVAQVLGPLAPGDYTAVYDVVSADGDENRGEVDFAFDGLDDEATNCLDPDFDESDNPIGQILLVAGPLVVVGGGLFVFNRWASRRAAEGVEA